MILVTGGSGFIGGHVVRALLARGSPVRCLVRSANSKNLDGLPVERVMGDLADPRALRRAARGCKTVFHCAGDYRLGAPLPAELYRTNVVGTRNVLEASCEAGVSRIVYTSSVGTLGLRADGHPADEETPVRLSDMVGHYKRSKFLAEREAEVWARRGAPVVIVNPSAPVGERDVKPTPTGRIVVDFLRGRMPAYVETGLNVVDVRDVAEGHLRAAEHGRPGEKYILGHRNMSLRELLETLAHLTGRRAPRLALPYWVPYALALLNAPWAAARKVAPRLSLESVRMSRKWMFFDPNKAVRELGLPQSPVEEALLRAVNWFERAGDARQ
jgi:dihydroflavonol-4-reductase